MLYNMFFRKECLSLQRQNKKVQDNKMFNRLRNAEAQTKTIMEKNVNEILMLRYQIKRYQAMRKGAMCQALNSKLQKLLAQQASAL